MYLAVNCRVQPRVSGFALLLLTALDLLEVTRFALLRLLFDFGLRLLDLLDLLETLREGILCFLLSQGGHFFSHLVHPYGYSATIVHPGPGDFVPCCLCTILRLHVVLVQDLTFTIFYFYVDTTYLGT